MVTEYLFVEFCALACLVALSFRLAGFIGRLWTRGEHKTSILTAKPSASMQASAGDDWYCFFRPSLFRRRQSSSNAAARTSAKKTSQPRARMTAE